DRCAGGRVWALRNEFARRDHAGHQRLPGRQVQRDPRRSRVSRGVPVRNVIFDFGGVLVNWQPEAIIAGFYAEVALRDALRTHVLQHDDWLEMDRGTFDEATVIRRFAARMRRPEAELMPFFDHL